MYISNESIRQMTSNGACQIDQSSETKVRDVLSIFC